MCPVVTVAFKQICVLNAAKRGMPTLRLVYSPHPVWGKSPDQLWAYMNGPDPATEKPMLPEMNGALTNPLTAEDKKTGTERPSVQTGQHLPPTRPGICRISTGTTATRISSRSLFPPKRPSRRC